MLSALTATSLAGTTVESSVEAGANAAAHTPVPVALEGVVVSARSFWDDGRIVTESVVQRDDGTRVVVSQPGGSVDDISQVQFPSPAILAPGDRVSLLLDATRPDRAQPILELVTLARSAKHDLATDPSGSVQLKYVRTTNDALVPLYFAKSCIQVTYHSAGTSHLAGDLEFQVMDQVFDTWRSATASCSYLTFDLRGRSEAEAELDLENMIIFREDVWGRPGCPEDPMKCHALSAAAVTTVSYINTADGARAGEIVDADIEINAVAFDVSAAGVSLGTNGCMSDLANTLTHEVGHMMGLEHTCFITAPVDTQGNPKPWPLDDQGNEVAFCSPSDPPELQATTMYPTQECGETIKITPEADDIAGVCGIYPLADDPGKCAAPDSLTQRACACTVGAANTGTLGAWPLFALGLALLLRNRRRRALARASNI